MPRISSACRPLPWVETRLARREGLLLLISRLPFRPDSWGSRVNSRSTPARPTRLEEKAGNYRPYTQTTDEHRGTHDPWRDAPLKAWAPLSDRGAILEGLSDESERLLLEIESCKPGIRFHDIVHLSLA